MKTNDTQHTQHTAGPWTRHDSGSMVGSVWSDNATDSTRNTLIANVVGPDVKTAEANARLIAAAPELLAALISAMSHIPNPDDLEDGRADSLDEYGKIWCREMHKAYRAAIAKATGQA